MYVKKLLIRSLMKNLEAWWTGVLSSGSCVREQLKSSLFFLEKENIVPLLEYLLELGDPKRVPLQCLDLRGHYLTYGWGKSGEKWSDPDLESIEMLSLEEHPHFH